MVKFRSNNLVKTGYIVILTIAILVGFISVNNKINANAETFSLNNNKIYSVVKVQANGSFTSLETYSNFNTAKQRMNALHTAQNPHLVTTVMTSERDANVKYTKIVAQPSGGYAQSYPYRKGSVNSAAARNTLEIFSNQDLTNSVGYVPGHYQMRVYDVVPKNNSFVVEIEISGLRGFVDINKVDLIPNSHFRNYKGEGGISLTMGGHESFYSAPQQPYTMLVKPEYYEVSKSGSYNEVTFYQYRTYPGMADGVTTFGVAPDWMGAGIYYSNDDIRYYKDFNRSQPVNNGGTLGEYYSYFQWLPVNTMSLHNGDTLRNYLADVRRTDSVYYNETQAFVENGNKYGMNALLVFAQANLESAYGTSKYAKSRNNLFGWNAVDSNPDNAATFASVSDSIKLHMNRNLMEYMQPGHWKHFGFSYGNMSSGVSVKYASDPLYGMKIAGIAYRTDKINGFKDYNNYKLTRIKDNTSVSFTPAANNNSSIYKNRAWKNQIVANLGASGSYTKTYRVKSPNSNGSINLTKDYVYFPTTGTSTMANYGPAASSLPASLVVVGETSKQYTFKSTQNLRTEWNNTSTVLTSIPAGTKLAGYPTNNGFVYFSYNGFKGYVQESLLNDGGVIPPTPGPSRSGTYKVSPSTNLNLREQPNTTSKVLASIPKSTTIKVEDVGNKEWGKVTYQGKTGYVHFDYITLVEKDEEEITFPLGDVNGDKKVSISDVALINSHLLGSHKLTGEFLQRADIKKDGKITIADAAMINSHLLGIRRLDE